jgi:hypothetical protein
LLLLLLRRDNDKTAGSSVGVAAAMMMGAPLQGLLQKELPVSSRQLPVNPS